VSVVVRQLSAEEASTHLDALADILADCVAGGASVSFMPPFGVDEAKAWWPGVIASVERGDTVLFGGFVDGVLRATAQIGMDGPCNQRHRGDVKKMLVHRAARRRGLARSLLQALESEAQARGLTLLTLDTGVGGEAEHLYAACGWTRAGIIPNYALWPDGRPCDTIIFWKALPALESPSL
jgi:GNAT superfamily N-acetyltransferase